MNAKPSQITVSLAISNRFTVEALEEFYDGIKAACSKYKVDLVGGDTTSSPTRDSLDSKKSKLSNKNISKKSV